MENKAEQIVDRIFAEVNHFQTSSEFIDERRRERLAEYRTEYLDQLVTGDCQCLIDFLTDNGYDELSAEVSKFLK
jgi:hypothetical protein